MPSITAKKKAALNINGLIVSYYRLFPQATVNSKLDNLIKKLTII
jgi:hypothetical protein